MNTQEETAKIIIATERAALNRWNKGDPSGFLEISAPDVVYFDPFQGRRIDGLETLTSYYESLRGKFQIDRDEFINPKVQLCGDAAVLTYNYVSHGKDGTMRWNCTEVYQKVNDKWRIVQTHWSMTQH